MTHPQYKQELTDYHDNNPIIQNSTVLKKWKIGTHLIFSIYIDTWAQIKSDLDHVCLIWPRSSKHEVTMVATHTTSLTQTGALRHTPTHSHHTPTHPDTPCTLVKSIAVRPTKYTINIYISKSTIIEISIEIVW